MSLTVTDLFCGAGGSSLGAEAVPGVRLAMAANHWATAVDVHQSHFPNAGHDLADISQADPRRYPVTDILIASPECTRHSQARGVSRRRQDPSLWDAPDPSAERSRATMWDVPRFCEQIPFAAVVVENVVEASKWVGWRAWHVAMADLRYEHRVLSVNSMHHHVPQSRDRIFVVFWRKGIRIDLDFEQHAWCPRCDAARIVRQGWKPNRSIGRYRQQWNWLCAICGTPCDPTVRGAIDIIDRTLPCPRIGDRDRPLVAATRRRVGAGILRHWPLPVITAGAGNTHERNPGSRAHTLDEPLPVQQASATHALATPPGFLVQTSHAGDDSCRTRGVEDPLWTVTASDDRPSFVVPLRSDRNRSHTLDDPMATIMAGGNYGGLVVPLRANGHATPTDTPVPTVTASGNHHALLTGPEGDALILRRFTPRGRTGQMATPVTDPLPATGASGNHALIMRNNGGGPEMVTPATEPIRTLTTAGHQSLLVPYYGNGHAQPVTLPAPTVTTRDRCALVDVDLDRLIDDCGFRMLEPHEIAAAMAFPAGYIPADLTKRDRVKLAGNAVTPPVMTAIIARIVAALAA